MISVIAGNQLFLFITSRPRTSTLGHSSMGKGTPLLGMICFAIRTDPVSRPTSGTSALNFGWVLRYGRGIGLLLMETSVIFSIMIGSTTAGPMVEGLGTGWLGPGGLQTDFL